MTIVIIVGEVMRMTPLRISIGGEREIVVDPGGDLDLRIEAQETQTGSDQWGVNTRDILEITR